MSKIKDEIRYYKKEIEGNPDFPRYIKCVDEYIRMLRSKTKRKE